MANDPVSLTFSTANVRSLTALLGPARRNPAPVSSFAAALAQAQDPAVAKQAAREMEGLFLNLLWQEMWRTVGQGSGAYLPKGLEGDIYRDFLTQAYAEKMVEAGGIGLSGLILNHLDR